MILKIELENFYSIKDKVVIDFRAAIINTAQARELSNNVIDWKGTKVLKSIGLFGANASGKSNIIKAICFCCRMILDSHLHNEGDVFNFQPFKFDGYADKPSRFLVDFVMNGTEYEYTFSLTHTEVMSEELYHYPNGRKAKIYTRNGHSRDNYTFSEGVIRRPFDVVVNTSPKNLFLSRASSMNRDVAQQLYRYFANFFLLGLAPIDDKSIETFFTEHKALILHALSVCDSDICNIEIVREQRNVPIPQTVDNRSLSITTKDVEIVRFRTYHRSAPSVPFDMESEESDGTRRLFGVLLRLLDVVRNGKSLMLDEFDIRLHTRLADFILDLIHASKSSQLLFTSHNTNLIDVKRLRRDQIVFANKKTDGSTEVYSLYDYKDFRENMDAEKGYTQGRFDAVPFVDSSVQSLKQLLKEE